MRLPFTRPPARRRQTMRWRARGGVLVFGLAAVWSAGVAAAETAAGDAVALLGEAVGQMPGELATVFRYPFDETPAFARYALGVGLLIAFDKPLTRAMQDHLQPALAGWQVSDAPAPFAGFGSGGADGWLALGIAGTWVGGLAFGDERAQRTGIAATKSLALSMVVSQLVLKSITGRRRPLASLSHDVVTQAPYTDDPWDFGHSRKPTFRADKDGSAMPSLHFTAWFAVARVYSEAWGNPWVPYSLLTLGLASDFPSHRHWVSDMVAGGLVGTLIGSVVARNTFEAPNAARWDMVPLDGGLRVVWSRRF